MKDLLSKDELEALYAETAHGGPGPGENADVILGVPVTLTVEAGRAELSIRELVNLNTHSLIELDRDGGTPMRVYANGRLIAQGQLRLQDGREMLQITALMPSNEAGEDFP